MKDHIRRASRASSRAPGARAGFLALCLTLGALTAAVASPSATERVAGLPDGLYAVIETARGAIVLELYPGKAPLAVTSFVGLAEGSLSPSGKPFFDGIVFHRVEPGFVIQGGDPTGTGTGGPGYKFQNEIDPSLSFGAEGVLGMANAGKDTNGSQFYVTLGPAAFLDGSYTVFGRVARGMEAVKKIAKGDRMDSVRIVRKGAAYAGFKADKAAFEAERAAFPAKEAERAKGALAAQHARVDARVPGLKPGPGGLRSKVLKEGSGAKPAKGAAVKVRYSLTLPDGRELDRSGPEPFSFQLGMGKVIPGFDLAVADMRPGERRVVAIPPELAYGERGAGGVVPPNAVLVFELELVGY